MGQIDHSKLSPKQAGALEKARKIIEWLEAKKPTQPAVVAPHMTIADPQKMISSHKAFLEFNEPLTLNWKAHYLRLYNLKESILQNE